MFQSLQDLPVGPVARNLPANAGDTSLIPGPGRVHVLPGSKAHAPQLVNPGEPEGRNYWAHTPKADAPPQEKPLQWEADAPQRRVTLLATTRGSLRAATNI